MLLRAVKLKVGFGFCALMLMVAGCSGRRPDDIGLKGGTFRTCPDKPNCVSSQVAKADEQHYIEPIPFPPADGTPQAVSQRLLRVVEGMSGSRVTSVSGEYLAAEFTSFVFRFVDDVEFFIDQKARVIHVRSASRVGYRDFGVNRSRIEKVRAKMHEAK